MALEKASAVGGAGVSAKKGGSAVARRTRWERRASSASRLRAVPIARAARSSAGAARMGFCGFAARAAGAPSMR